MFRPRMLALTVVAWGWMAACSAPPTATPTATPDLTAEAETTSLAATKAAADARATEAAESLAATDQAATTQAHETAEVIARDATLEAATAMAWAESTRQAGGMLELVEQLQLDGYLESTSGTYHALADFDESWAQINWYQWWYTGFTPTDFVVRADAVWESASEDANWYASGCGFVFREDGEPNHYLAYLGLDGNVYFNRTIEGKWAQMWRSRYGLVDTLIGGAKLMLVVEGSAGNFFVNDERVLTWDYEGLASGNLALALLSGTNTGYGTHCRMSNIELWQLD